MQWRRGNAIIGKTGKVRPDSMLYKKQELYCPEGYFIIRTSLEPHRSVASAKWLFDVVTGMDYVKCLLTALVI
jgi:hypothetical protein